MLIELRPFLIVYLLFLNSHNITCWICTISSSILEAWDHWLNDDLYSFTIDIRIPDEVTL